MEWLININFWGVVHGTRAFLPHLSAQREAHIVNLSSIFGIIAPPGQTAYCAAKFAVRGFSESLRHELKMAESPVRVLVVHPGGIATDIARNSRMRHRRHRQCAPHRGDRPLRQAGEEVAGRGRHAHCQCHRGQQAAAFDRQRREVRGDHSTVAACDLLEAARPRAREARGECGGEVAISAPRYSVRSLPLVGRVAHRERERTMRRVGEIASTVQVETPPPACASLGNPPHARSGAQVRCRARGGRIREPVSANLLLTSIDLPAHQRNGLLIDLGGIPFLDRREIRLHPADSRRRRASRALSGNSRSRTTHPGALEIADAIGQDVLRQKLRLADLAMHRAALASATACRGRSIAAPRKAAR